MALHYKIALTNVWWNSEYKDVRRFSSYSERATYFNLDSIFTNSPAVNLDIKNLINPRIVFKAPNRDVFDVLNSNYLIVNNHNAVVESQFAKQKYYFYFIDKIVQDSGDMYIADCKLDVWTTFIPYSNMGQGFIERAHLDRFTTDPDLELGLNFAPESPLMIEERSPSENDKILVERKKLCIAKYNRSKTIRARDWFSDNISGWVYVFVEAYKTYKFPKFTDDSQSPTENNVYLDGESAKGVNFPYAILVYPVYKSAKKIFIKTKDPDNQDIKILLGSNLGYFQQFNNDYSFVYSKKILPVNPFTKILKSIQVQDTDFTYPDSWLEIDTDGNLIVDCSSSGILNTRPAELYSFQPDLQLICSYPPVLNVPTAIINLAYSGRNVLDLLLLEKLTISNISPLGKPYITNKVSGVSSKADIKQLFNNHALRARKFNPKLFGASYYEVRLNIANQGASSFSYAQLANVIEQEENLFIARASLVPEVETLSLSPYKSYYLVDSKDYESAFATIITSDFSIAFKNDVYEQFLANNKNFWLQNKVNWQKKAFDLFTGSLLSGDYTTKGAGKLLRGGVDISVDMFSTKYQVNNMQNAPDNYSAGSGQVSYLLSYEDGVSYYLDFYKVPDCILKRDDDYMHLYGFKVGRLMNFSDVVNIRAYFNYVQGNFENIDGIKSEEVRRILKDSLLTGVRFWNVDRSSEILERENFENRLISD